MDLFIWISQYSSVTTYVRNVSHLLQLRYKLDTITMKLELCYTIFQAYSHKPLYLKSTSLISYTNINTDLEVDQNNSQW